MEGVRRLRAPLGPLLLVLLGGGAAPVGTAAAQTVRGILVEAESGAPIAGAFVVLQSPSGQRLDAGLSSSSGHFVVHAPGPGTYRLRSDRIGYASASSEPFELAPDEDVSRRLEVTVRPVELAAMAVESRSRCEMLPTESLEIHTVWEEARKALTALVWTGQQHYYRFDALLFERDLDSRGEPTGEPAFEEVRVYGRHPFRSAGARDLALGGFVRPSGGLVVYYAPDADVLLSRDFLARHCFRLVRGDDRDSAAFLGLAFEPIPERRVPDISGTMWIDTESSELRSLDFRYENLQVRVSTRNLGGRVVFARLPSGAWIVRSWVIRVPVIGPGPPGRSVSGRFLPPRQVLRGIDEGGGHVTAVWMTGELAGAVSTDTLPVRPPPDSLIARFPVPF